MYLLVRRNILLVRYFGVVESWAMRSQKAAGLWQNAIAMQRILWLPQPLEVRWCLCVWASVQENQRRESEREREREHSTEGGMQGGRVGLSFRKEQQKAAGNYGSFCQG